MGSRLNPLIVLAALCCGSCRQPSPVEKAPANLDQSSRPGSEASVSGGGSSSGGTTGNAVAPGVPVWPAGATVTATRGDNGMLALTWTPVESNPGLSNYLIIEGGSAVARIGPSAPSWSLPFPPGEQATLEIEAINSVGVSTGGPTASVSSPSVDPVSAAPPIDATAGAPINQTVSFLYTGTNPVIVGVDAGSVDPVRVAVMRGRVMDRSGNPLPRVEARVVNHDEWGRTATRSDGTYDLVASGGGSLTVDFFLAGYLRSQRTLTVRKGDFTRVDDVALIPLDPVINAVSLGGPSQLARGSAVQDASGARQATVYFPAGTTANLAFDDGTQTPAPSLSLHLTEYTVGDAGESAMPGSLPESSAYTYALSFTADEAEELGARSVTLSQPVYGYVENFLGFPVGSPVPAAWYDRVATTWSPVNNGVVIQVLALDGGAGVDVTGSGDPATADQLSTLGLSDDELTTLGRTWAPGTSLWRVPLPHFTAFDWNSTPRCSSQGGTESCPPPYGLPPVPYPDNACEMQGSIIECETQDLAEEFPVAGTPWFLRYDSRRTPGRTAEMSTTIPLSGSHPAATLAKIRLRVEIAGEVTEKDFAPAPNLSYTFTWDGRDAYGRPLVGIWNAHVSLTYDYQSLYGWSAQSLQSFAQFNGMTVSQVNARSLTPLSRSWDVALGTMDQRALGLGGLSISPHHTYLPMGTTVARGDGSYRTPQSVPGGQVTMAGNGGAFGSAGDGGSPQGVGSADQIAVDPQGDVFVADAAEGRLLEISATTHQITALNGPLGSLTPLVNGALLSEVAFQPAGVAVRSDGSLVFSINGGDLVSRIWAADTRGHLTLLAGGGSKVDFTSGSPAEAAALESNIEPTLVFAKPDGRVVFQNTCGQNALGLSKSSVLELSVSGELHQLVSCGAPIDRIAVGPDGALYFTRGGALYRVGVNGTVLIGGRSGALSNGTQPLPVDGTLAAGAFLGLTASDDSTVNTGAGGDLAYLAQGMTVGGDGSIYFTSIGNEGAGMGVVALRAIRPDGTLSTLFQRTQAGKDQGQGSVSPGIGSMVITPANELYVVELQATADSTGGKVEQVNPPPTGLTVGDQLTPSADGTEVYQFDSSGRHLATFDGLTGAKELSFGYDTAGRLELLADANGNVTTIHHDAQGNPTEIVAPQGQVTTVSVDANGFVSGITDPVGAMTQLKCGGTGLLGQLTDPEGNVHSFEYDSAGRLTSDSDPAGGRTTLTSAGVPTDMEITTQTVDTAPRTLLLEATAAGDLETITSPGNQVSTSLQSPSGSLTGKSADGTTSLVQYAPDPRFGMLAPIAGTLSLTTPSGLTANLTQSIQTELRDPADPLSVQRWTSTTSLNGKSWVSIWDADGGAYTVTSPEGRPATQILDSEGRVVRLQQLEIDDVTVAYDAQGRVSQVAQDELSTTFTWDDAGYLSQTTDALGDVVALRHDADGRTTRVDLGEGSAATEAYDLNGNATSLVPPGQPPHSFGYSSIDLPTSYSPPVVDGGADVVGWAYDADRLVKTLTRADGTALTFTYDRDDRPTGMSWGTQNVQFTWFDGGGQLRSVVSPDETVSYRWDGDLVTDETWSGAASGIVYLKYDDDFRFASVGIGQQQLAAYGYDGDGLLTSVNDLALGRDALNGQLDTASVQGLKTTFTHDRYGSLASAATEAGKHALFTDEYTRDGLKRIISDQTTTPDGATHTLGYAYDRQGRLTDVTNDGTPFRTYAYDVNGNRVSATFADGGSVQAIFDARDRLVSYGDVAFSYTANGDRLTRTDTSNGDTTSYEYDPLGDLVWVGLPDGGTIDYLVDGQGQRIGKKINGKAVETYLYQSAIQPAAKMGADGKIVQRYVYGTHVNVPDLILDADGNEYRVITSAQGSVIGVIDTSTSKVVQEMRYDEWGNVVYDSNPGFQPFGFAGGLYDRDTGLTRFGYRDYDAQVGKWMSRDPLLFGGGDWNLYRYSGGDPINAFDPLGLDSVGSSAEFDGNAHTVTIYDPDPNDDPILVEPAYNNVISGKQSFPDGTYNTSGWKPADVDPNGSYGTNGFLSIPIPHDAKKGMHSGRANKGGPKAKTKGCIRTTEKAMSAVRDLAAKGIPVTSVTVVNGQKQNVP